MKTNLASLLPPVEPEPVVRARDGVTASAEDGAIALRDAAGRLLLRWEDGALIVEAGAADLELRASGRLRLDAATVEVRGAERVVTTAPAVETRADRASLVAQSARTEVVLHELVASRVVETARDVFREAVDLCHTRIGKARTIVSELWSLRAGRTTIRSAEETQIDGKKVLLG